jgi:hypothetical protein
MSLLSQPGGIVAMFPGGAVGMFGPRGFTRMPAVAAILDEYEVGDPCADLVTFLDLPRSAAVRLLKLLPANQADVAAQGAPSFADLIAATRRCATARFTGVRITPRRLDERILLDAVTISGDDVTPACRRRLEALQPVRLEVTERRLTARWT